MKLIDYVFAARPLLHIPVWSVYLVSLNYQKQATESGFSWLHLLMISCLSLVAVGAYYTNQIHDYESDRINRKVGFLQGHLVGARGLTAASVVCWVVAILVSLISSKLMLFVFVQGVALAYFYSAPPFRLKDRPFAGLLANAYTFGFLVPVVVRLSYGGNDPELPDWNMSVYFFLTVASIHIMTTLPDREGDRATRKRTVAVVLNNRAAKLLALALMAASAVVAWHSQNALLTYLSFLSVLPLVGSLFVRSGGWELLAAKLPLLLLTLLAGYFYLGYLLFMVALLTATRIYYVRRFGIAYPKLA